MSAVGRQREMMKRSIAVCPMQVEFGSELAAKL
jgi:hypothetical protein